MLVSFLRRRSIATATSAFLIVGLTSVGVAGAAQDPFDLSASAAPAVAGAAVQVTSIFEADSVPTGRYVLDTEIWKDGNRVAQWFETRDVAAGSRQEVSGIWNTGSATEGTYSIRTGVFNDNWSGLVDWDDDAGNVKLAKAEWKSSATAKLDGSKVNVSATVKAPLSGARIVDVEIFDKDNNRVGQHFETRSFNTDSQTVSASIEVGGRPSPFTVKVGIFDQNWQVQNWNDNAGRTGAVAAAPAIAAPAPTTTTTAAPIASRPVAPTTTAPVAAAAPKPAPAINTGNPYSATALYADPNAQALGVAAQLKAQGRTADAALIEKIGKTPTGIWLGEWSGDIRTATSNVMKASKSQGQMPTFIAYNIPGRDCGLYSAGGANGSDAYKAWISGLAAGIGSAKAAVILEPDALPGIDCLSEQGKADRYALINFAVDKLQANGNTTVYLDAGNYTWQNTTTMTERLNKAGVAKARGFSLNVSGYNPTAETVNYGNDLANKLGGKHYVVDTSRNGNGGNGEWCNPSGRKLGIYPTALTGHSAADAFLWLKAPGESDGTCNGGPSAGTFWTEYALGLAR